MQGQANHFVRAAKEKIAYGMQRYVGETERLYGILDARLKDRDYVVGPGRGKYSIADIALLGWVNAIRGTTISIDQFPAVKAWLTRCWERPAVQRGFQVPAAPASSALKSQEGEAAKTAEELKVLVDKAKEQYGYVYSSP
jgi:glutathione S-transferase